MLSPALVNAWRSAVLELARLPRELNPKDIDPEQLLLIIMRQEIAAVSELWEVFTKERGELSRGLLSGKRASVAYLLGFHLANAARAQLTLSRAAERFDLASVLKDRRAPVRWHDLGCGTGAVAQAAADFLLKAGLPREDLDLRLYDATGTLLDTANTLFKHAKLPITTHRLALESLSAERLMDAEHGTLFGYSLGYVWNELEKNPAARTRLLRTFEGHATRGDEALVLVLEPAMQALSRAAMDMRDKLVAQGYVPLYLCPAATRCPMLRLSRDWCFSEGDWRRPKAMQILDEALGMDRSRLTGSFFLFASPALAPRLQAHSTDSQIVVGRPVRIGAKARLESPFDYLLCTGSELKKTPPRPGKPCLPRGLPLNG